MDFKCPYLENGRSKLQNSFKNRVLRVRITQKTKKNEKKILVIFGIYTTFLDFDDLFLANGASKTENKYQNRIPHVRITQKVENAAENLFF